MGDFAGDNLIVVCVGLFVLFCSSYFCYLILTTFLILRKRSTSATNYCGTICYGAARFWAAWKTRACLGMSWTSTLNFEMRGPLLRSSSSSSTAGGRPHASAKYMESVLQHQQPVAYHPLTSTSVAFHARIFPQLGKDVVRKAQPTVSFLRTGACTGSCKHRCF